MDLKLTMLQILSRISIIFSVVSIVGAISIALIDELLIIKITWFAVGLISFLGQFIWIGFASFAVVILLRGVVVAKGRTRLMSASLLLISSLLFSWWLHGWIRSQNLFYHLHEELYNEAAQLILNGDFQRVDRDIILPDKFDSLSVGDFIWSYRRGDAIDIIFAQAGFAGELVGYIYSSDSKTPMTGARVEYVEGTDGHWYRGNNDTVLFLTNLDQD